MQGCIKGHKSMDQNDFSIIYQSDCIEFDPIIRKKSESILVCESM